MTSSQTITDEMRENNKLRIIYITDAAIRGVNQIFIGRRHCHIIREMVHAGEPIPITGEQGFINNKGQFINRTEAAKVAFIAGQIKTPKPTLFSEDVW